ncbi:MAG: ATP-binding protein [Desulfobacterales bacterium]|nr:ATP-binding protein [Desulfobacterales bacterium]
MSEKPSYAELENRVAELETVEAKLNSIQQQFFSIVDNIRIGIALIDHGMEILEMNRQMREWFPGFEAGKGHICYRFFSRPSREGPCDSCPTVKTLKDGEVRREKIVISDKDGYRTFRVTTSPIFDETGNVKSAIEILEDVTGQITLERQLLQAQKMESIGKLAGGIAHDFNNLLFPITGLSELLLEDLPQDSPEYQNAREIYGAARRAGDLVRQILAFSRQSDSKKRRLRIDEILTEVVQLSRSTIPSNIEIIDSIRSDCAPVQAESSQIHQVAMNLITNAYHAVEEINGRIKIGLDVMRLEEGHPAGHSLALGEYVVLSVSDNGSGMDEDTLNRMFEPYFTTKSRDKGTGLGLSVVHGIVKDHSGGIFVESHVGEGTRVRVYLPVADEKKTDEAQQPHINGNTGTERILLVDDEVSVAKLEAEILKRLGYTVNVQYNSLTALDVFQSQPDAFDLVITDMTMPGMTGDVLAKAVMTIRPDIPVIICTGFSEKMNPEKARQMGVKGYLRKPVLKSKMALTLRKILDKPDAPQATE